MAKTPTKKTEESKKPAATKKATAAPKAKAPVMEAKTVRTAAAKAPKVKKVRAKREKTTRCGGKTCQIQACKRAYRAKGYCNTHYREWRAGKFGTARYKTCKDLSCFKPMAKNRHGFCEDHFQNYYVKGVEQAKPAAPAKPEKAPEAAPAQAAG